MKKRKRKVTAAAAAVLMLMSLILYPLQIYASPEEADYQNTDTESSVLWDGDIASGFANGDGSVENPFEISNGEELALLAYLAGGGEDFSGVNFVMTADIDLGDVQWTPIGNRANAFQGIFDGKYHTLSGLYIDTHRMYQGLFGYLGPNSIVRNLTIENSYIAGGDFTGSVAGAAAAGSVIENAASQADVSGISQVGGIAGYSMGTIENSSSGGTVSGFSAAGGIAGLGHTLKQVKNSGAVSSRTHLAGGITGELHGSVKDSSNTGAVAVGSFYGGGIVGSIAASGTVIERSYNRGSVSGNSYMGGIVGMAEQMTLISCFNDGKISGTYGTGGIAGVSSKSSIQSCYDTGAVNGREGAGGIAGRVLMQGSFVSCYSIGEISGTAAVGNIAGSTVDASVQISSSFYLEGSSFSAVGEGSGTAGALSSAELKESSARLGDAYMQDDPEYPVNKGYPILKGIDYGAQPGPGPGPEPGEGSGTEEDPYILDSADGLELLGEEPDAWFELQEDIDLDGGEWEPVELFTGSLNGNGREIRGLEVDGTGSNNGLFKELNGAEISNLVIADGSVSGDFGTGMLAGFAVGAKIENCIIQGGMITGPESVGGLIGEAEDCIIRNITISADVSGNYMTGGLVGYAGDTVIEEVRILGDVKGGEYAPGAEVGGIAGMRSGGRIERSYVAGSVTGADYTGGLVGVDISGSSGWIRDCYVLGDVSGKAAGGLVGDGFVPTGQLNISNCYFAGILVDFLGWYDNLVPDVSRNCYFDISKNPEADQSQTVFGRTAVQMGQRETYAEWDFETVWRMMEGEAYPVLRAF